MNALLNGAIDVATDLLAEHSEFAPFAMAMASEDGEIFHIEPDEDEADDGASDEVILAALYGGLRESVGEGRWRAIAVCADVTLEGDDGEPITSAILVRLEHEGEAPVSCTVPYEIGEETVELSDELLAEPGEAHVFVTETPPN